MTQEARTAQVVTHRGYFLPGVQELPKPLPSIQWTWWRWALLMLALGCSTYFFVSVNMVSWGNNYDHRASTYALFMFITKQVVAAAMVLGCLWGIAGTRAAGIAHGQSWEHHRIGLGYYMRTVYPVAVLLVGLKYMSLQLNPPPAPSGSGNGVSVPFALDLYWAFAAGFVEEIIATVFLYWLLQHIPWRRGTTLAASGVGTAIIIFAHWSYHAQYGVAVLHVVAAVYFSVICWRYTQSLWALVIGHMLWDVVVLIPNLFFAALAALMLAALGLVMDMYMQIMVVKPQKA